MSDIVRTATKPAGQRGAVLKALKAAKAPMSIAAIAGELEVHPNTVRFHLDRLVNEGQVEQVSPARKGPGRPPLLFRAIRQMDRGGPRHYRLLAEILASAFAAERDPGAKALAAGQAWGQQLEPPAENARRAGKLGAKKSIDHLVDTLDELGFAPERRGQHQLGLRHCPFLELAEARAAVVCPIHLGLMQGALKAWDAPVAVDRLDVFAEPDLCMAHFTSGAAT